MPVSIGSGWKIGGGWSMGSGGAAPPPPPAVTDPYFMYNSLLLTGDGTNNSQNNTFLDSSTNNFAVTRAGNTTQGTFSPYGANWSNYFNGSNAYWKQASSANYILGTNDFTLECWFNPGDTTVNMRRLFGVGYGGNGGSHGNSWELLFWGTESPTGQIGLNRYDGSTGTSWTTTGVTITAGQWYHIAVSRTGGFLKVFVNGTAYYSAANTFNFTQVTYGGNTELWCGLGYYGPSGGLSGPRYLNGYLSNIRIINGTGIYSSNFTPPTAPLTAVANTQLLAAQSNRFVDNSANAQAITTGGSPSTQGFSPFSPTAAYSSSTIGGSGYFDGTGDYLTTPDSSAFGFGTGDFTVELWAYCSFNSAIQALVDGRPSNITTPWALTITGTGVARTYDGTSVRTGGQLIANAWNHLVWARASNVNTIYVNGVVGHTWTASQDFGSTRPLTIAGLVGGGGELFTGYLSNLRIVKGTAVYTTAFTPPTAPVTAIANTQLLLNYTNAGIIDNAMMNDLETVGGAKISTTQSKFGGSSMAFDGTGDYIVSALTATPNLNLGSGSYTLEFWVNPTALVNEARMVTIEVLSSTTVGVIMGGGAAGGSNNDIQVNLFGVGTRLSASAVLTTGTWVHVAVTYNGTTSTLWVGGVSKNTYAGSVFPNANCYVTIGGSVNYSSSLFNGYLDDVRITKGYARYTTNFTPPTAALPTY